MTLLYEYSFVSLVLYNEFYDLLYLMNLFSLESVEQLHIFS